MAGPSHRAAVLADYCPLVRRTEKLSAGFGKNLTERACNLVAAVDPAVLKRAVHYLFTKETKSSFAIEGEAPSKGRTERFIAALMRAEKFDPTAKPPLIELQNAIVDPRYAQGRRLRLCLRSPLCRRQRAYPLFPGA